MHIYIYIYIYICVFFGGAGRILEVNLFSNDGTQAPQNKRAMLALCICMICMALVRQWLAGSLSGRAYQVHHVANQRHLPCG